MQNNYFPLCRLSQHCLPESRIIIHRTKADRPRDRAGMQVATTIPVKTVSLDPNATWAGHQMGLVDSSLRHSSLIDNAQPHS
ncbi:hypothetical protein CTA1_10104 [Colletotrichum tanaceti]|uniref:Uncharacterized protein n=1 Tax=Colletotrichum tanaceti TaxID=1306861 RepID=A0A4U6WYA5_9PEZI|nr:hypothetical protein CTA1_10104 [Colletotrichum tanaceti]